MMDEAAVRRINELRVKSLTQDLPLEEFREAIRLMRGDRIGAAKVSTTARGKKAPVDTDSLLGQLEGM